MTEPPLPSRRRLPAWLLPVGLFVVLAWPVIFSGFVKGRGAFDQLNYHEQVVRTFAEQLPTPDYRDYLSATTPGYHTVLAVVARVVSDERWVLQLAGSLFTVGLVGMLAWGVRWYGSPTRDGEWHGSPNRERQPVAYARGSWVVVLPVVVSMPVFYSGVWMLPDNAGWLGVLAVWLFALRPKFDSITLVGGGATLAALVFVRQIHLWPLAMLLTAAWLGGRSDPDTGFDFSQDLHTLLSDIPARLVRTALVLLAAVPAVAVLWWVWRMWGSLTPPVFHERHVGGNPSAPVFVLAVFGMYAVFFLPFVLEGLHRLWVRHTWLLGLSVLLGLALALAVPTTRDPGAGRSSGLWEIANLLPTPMGRSVLMVPLAVLGSVLVAAWLVVLGRRDRWIMLASLVAFTAAQCASLALWQRYTEPMILIWLALAASRVSPARSPAGEGWRVLGPVALAGGLALVTTASLVLAGPVGLRVLLFPGETEAPILPGMLGSGREERNRDDAQTPINRSRDEDPRERSFPPR